MGPYDGGSGKSLLHYGEKETRREGTFYLRVEKDLLTEVSAQVIPLVKVGFDNYNNKKEGDGT